MKKKLVLISEGERPIWQIIIATLFYTIGIVTLLLFFYRTEFKADDKTFKTIFQAFEFSFYFFVLGFGFSVVKNVLFNLEENIYKDEYSVGPLNMENGGLYQQ